MGVCMKNLIMIHLESLNYSLFMRFPHIFREIYKLKEKGHFYNHYFSTSTSTLMVIGDMAYGGKEQYEVCSSLDFIPREYFYKESLFDELNERGYKTGIFVYPDGSDRESAEERHIVGFNNEMQLISDYNDFIHSIDSLIGDTPYAVWACNYISNLSINRYTDPRKICTGTEKWKRGYQYLDCCVGDIISLLEKKNKINDTCVILYGDHGDDFWGHGMHGGLTHAVEPYATLIHTPLIVLDRDLPTGVDESLICATDLKAYIEGSLGIRKSMTISNKYVIARSSYAAQPVRKETFNKAYSITDGKFLMLVSANGLELYDIEMDFQCCFNFLELYLLDGNIIRYNEEKNRVLGFHYLDFMNEAEILLLRQTAYYFRKHLYDETLKLYEIAGKTEADMNDEMNFNRIHYQKR